MTDDVLSVRYSPNGKLLAVALLDSTVKVFYQDSLKFFLSLYGHKVRFYLGTRGSLAQGHYSFLSSPWISPRIPSSSLLVRRTRMSRFGASTSATVTSRSSRTTKVSCRSLSSVMTRAMARRSRRTTSGLSARTRCLSTGMATSSSSSRSSTATTERSGR